MHFLKYVHQSNGNAHLHNLNEQSKRGVQQECGRVTFIGLPQRRIVPHASDVRSLLNSPVCVESLPFTDSGFVGLIIMRNIYHCQLGNWSLQDFVNACGSDH